MCGFFFLLFFLEGGGGRREGRAEESQCAVVDLKGAIDRVEILIDRERHDI